MRVLKLCLAIEVVCGIGFSFAQFSGSQWGTPTLTRTLQIFGTLDHLREAIPDLVSSREKLFSNYQTALTQSSAADYVHQRAMINKSPSELWVPGETLSPESVLAASRSFLIGVASDDQQTLSALSRWKPWKGQWDPQNYTYGTLYLAVTGAWLFTAQRLGFLENGLHIENLLQSPDTVTSLYRWARSFSAVCALGAAALLITFLLPAAGAAWAVAGALLFLSSPLTDVMSHLAKPHLLGALLVLAGLGVALRKRSLNATALCWGLASATLVTNFFFLAFLPTFAQGETTRKRLITTGKALGIGIATAILFNPVILLNTHAFLSKVLYHHIGSYEQGRFDLLGTQAFLKAMTWDGFPFLLLPLSVLGAWSWKQRPDQRALWTAWWISMVFLAANTVMFRHGGLALVPLALLCVSAAGGAQDMFRRSRGAGCGAIALIILVLAMKGHSRWESDLRYSREGNLTRAGEWINTHLPAGSSLGLVTSNLSPSTMPAFNFQTYRLQTLSSAPRQGHGPDFVIEPCLEGDWPVLYPGYEILQTWERRPATTNPFMLSSYNNAVRIARRLPSQPETH